MHHNYSNNVLKLTFNQDSTSKGFTYPLMKTLVITLPVHQHNFNLFGVI